MQRSVVFNEKLLFIFFYQYVVKVLMGAVDDWFDTLDERRVTSKAPTGRKSSKGKKKDACSIL